MYSKLKSLTFDALKRRVLNHVAILGIIIQIGSLPQPFFPSSSYRTSHHFSTSFFEQRFSKKYFFVCKNRTCDDQTKRSTWLTLHTIQKVSFLSRKWLIEPTKIFTFRTTKYSIFYFWTFLVQNLLPNCVPKIQIK